MSRIALIPGDGIGAEVTAEAVKVFRTVAARTGSALEPVAWDLGAECYLRTCVTITPPEMCELPGHDAIFPGRDRRPARARQGARARHPARHAVSARPVHQPPNKANAMPHAGSL